jgi:hypothetical protein
VKVIDKKLKKVFNFALNFWIFSANKIYFQGLSLQNFTDGATTMDSERVDTIQERYITKKADRLCGNFFEWNFKNHNHIRRSVTDSYFKKMLFFHKLFILFQKKK